MYFLPSKEAPVSFSSVFKQYIETLCSALPGCPKACITKASAHHTSGLSAGVCARVRVRLEGCLFTSPVACT